jgi:hypothetical protein
MSKMLIAATMLLGLVSVPAFAQEKEPAKPAKEAAPKVEKKKLTDAEVKKRLKDKKTTVNVEEMELTEVLALLAKAADVEIALAEGVSGSDPVTLSLKDASVESILKVLLATLDLAWEAKDGTVLIKAAESK